MRLSNPVNARLAGGPAFAVIYNDDNEPDTLRVISLASTNDGFTILFDEPFAPGDVELHGSQGVAVSR